MKNEIIFLVLLSTIGLILFAGVMGFNSAGQTPVQANLTQDTGCCSVIVHVQPGYDVVSYRRDSNYPADMMIERINFNGQPAIKQYKTQNGYFTHLIITKNGWIICMGGRDITVVNGQLEKLGSDAMSRGYIDGKDVQEALKIIKSGSWGHFLIKSPTDDVGLAGYDFRSRSSRTELFKIEDGEFVKLTNNPNFYNHANFNQFSPDPIDAAIKIEGLDMYGIDRRDVTTYQYANNGNMTKVNIWASYDAGNLLGGHYKGGPDNILFKGNEIRGEELPKIPDKKYLGEEILQIENPDLENPDLENPDLYFVQFLPLFFMFVFTGLYFYRVRR